MSRRQLVKDHVKPHIDRSYARERHIRVFPAGLAGSSPSVLRRTNRSVTDSKSKKRQRQCHEHRQQNANPGAIDERDEKPLKANQHQGQ